MCTYKKVLDFLKSIPTLKEVGLFYLGESALCKDLATYYKMLKEIGYFTYLTTNGTIYDPVAAALPYIDSLKISWNYSDIFDFKKKTNGTDVQYCNIMQNIDKLHELCQHYNKRLSVSTINDGDREKYYAALKQLKYHDHYWIPLQTQCGTIENGEDGVVGEDDCKSSNLPCWSLFNCIYIDVDGNVRSCCYGHEKQHVMYSALDVSKFYLCDKHLNMRKQHLERTVPNECKSCLKHQLKHN